MTQKHTDNLKARWTNKNIDTDRLVGRKNPLETLCFVRIQKFNYALQKYQF